MDGLLAYATIAERHEKNEEALGVLLRLVVCPPAPNPLSFQGLRIFLSF